MYILTKNSKKNKVSFSQEFKRLIEASHPYMNDKELKLCGSVFDGLENMPGMRDRIKEHLKGRVLCLFEGKL